MVRVSLMAPFAVIGERTVRDGEARVSAAITHVTREIVEFQFVIGNAQNYFFKLSSVGVNRKRDNNAAFTVKNNLTRFWSVNDIIVYYLRSRLHA